MPRKYAFLILAAGFIFILAVYLTERISGGQKMRDEVILAAKANPGVLGYFGDIREIERQRGYERVDLDLDGNRKGFLSLTVHGSQHSGTILVNWAKIGTNSVEITKVWHTAPFKDDVLFWPGTTHK